MDSSYIAAFCSEVRKTIFNILYDEQQNQKTDHFREAPFMKKVSAITSNP